MDIPSRISMVPGSISELRSDEIPWSLKGSAHKQEANLHLIEGTPQF